MGFNSAFKELIICKVYRQESSILQEKFPVDKLCRYNQTNVYQKLNGYGDNGERGFRE
jgi:hypothetical protein